MKVVQLDQANLRDMPARLRDFADGIEKKKNGYEEIKEILLVTRIPGEEPCVFGFGNVGGRPHVVGLLFQAAQRIALYPSDGPRVDPNAG